MKDQLIKAINIFSNLYPDHQINFIYLYDIDDNKVQYRIKGIKGNREISDRITIDL